MLTSTRTALGAMMSADPSITPEQKKAFLQSLLSPAQMHPQPMARIIRREEVAHLLGVSVKRVDQLCLSGVLKRITVPGTSRAIGISEASVRAIPPRWRGSPRCRSNTVQLGACLPLPRLVCLTSIPAKQHRKLYAAYFDSPSVPN